MKMSEHSPQTDWLETELTSMSSAGDSLAKISAMPGRGQASQGSDPAYGMNSTGSLKKSTRATRSSKTYQPFAIADWTLYSGASLRSGMTRSGTVYALPALDCRTAEIAYGLWPTPRTSDSDTPSMPRVRQIQEGRSWHAFQLREAMLSIRADLQSKYAPPSLYEQSMGFPLGWTDLKPSEMPSSRKSQKSSAKR
jgi:hypothetical protein